GAEPHRLARRARARPQQHDEGRDEREPERARRDRGEPGGAGEPGPTARGGEERRDDEEQEERVGVERREDEGQRVERDEEDGVGGDALAEQRPRELAQEGGRE